MADAKIQALSEKLIFVILVVFPFGQLFSINLVPAWGIRVQPIDLLAALSVPLVLLVRRKNELAKPSLSLLTVFLFSLLFSAAFFGISPASGAYLVRFVSYIALFNLVAVVFARSVKFKKTILLGLIVGAGAAAALGWYQYFVYPDFRPFKIIGWDDHLFRLVGSFFDPGFLGIILVLGFVLCLGNFLTQRSLKMLLITLFLLLTIAFTYSRASYLAIVTGTLILFYLKKFKSALLILLLGVFSLILLFLPRPSSEGVKLERLASVNARAVNYQQTLAVWQLSPVLGIGFNNMCLVRQTLVKGEDYASHSCSGADSSLLFVLATTGIVGLLVFGGYVIRAARASKGVYGDLALASGGALLVHSAFVNSLFYPWVLAWFALLLGISRGSKG